MNNYEAVKNAMKGASKEERKVLPPDKLPARFPPRTPAQRIEELNRIGAPTWEIEYWEDVEREEIDRIPRDRLGSLALKRR